MYVAPIKQCFYLSFTEEVSMTWVGGRDLVVDYPCSWDDAYQVARLNWMMRASEELKGDTMVYRHRANKLFVDTAQCHAGGLVVNVFTGIGLKSDIGTKCLVSPAFNQFNYLHQGVTVQHGIYDSDLYPGDFSFNLQFTRQDQKITFKAFDPVASLLFYKPEEMTHAVVNYGSGIRWQDQMNKADDFYRRKALQRLPYSKNIGCPITGEKS
jgi:hypothetical protein